ncbi:MAG: ABC transporter permease [Gemmatimonadaceae bacterium]|nr:ABC transporter permease [Gemmatimonadaceae bacterium]
MGRVVLSAVSRIAAVTVAAVVLSFTLVLFAPGEALSVAAEGRSVSAGVRDTLRARAGLDRSAMDRVRAHMGQLAHGDLGVSTVDARPVRDILRESAPRTALLTGSALVLAILLGVTVGTARAWRPNSQLWHVANGALTALYALPELVLGVALLALFSRALGWLPPGGMTDPLIELTGGRWARLLDLARHLALPAMTLALAWCAAIVRQQREATREATRSAHVRTARAKGMTESHVLRHDVLRLTAPALWIVVGGMLPVLMAGAVLVETLYGWPGLGQIMVQAVTARDAPVVAGATLLVSFATVTASVLVETAVRLTDPRVGAGHA